MENNFKHKQVGEVYDISISSAGAFAYVLAQRENADHTPLLLGQYIILEQKKLSNSYFFCVVEEFKPDLPEGISPKQIIYHSKKSKKSIDTVYEREAIYLGYKCRILGTCKVDQKGKVSFYSGVRSLPSVHQLVASIPSASFMNLFFKTTVEASDNKDGPIYFEIGHLQYGTNPDDTSCYPIGTDEEVKVYFNVSNLLRKRTGIFGKSGYGKSNNVKAVIGMIAREKESCGQLIFDTNGEYALDNAQNDGLMDIFYEAGKRTKCVLYSNKTIPQKIMDKYGKDCIRPLKFDVFANIRPAYEIVEANLEGDKEPMYLTPWISALMNEEDQSKYFSDQKNPGLIYGIYYQALYLAGLTPATTKQPYGQSVQITKDFLNYLAKQNQLENGEKEENVVDFHGWSNVEEKEKILKEKSIIKSKTANEYFSTHIPTMAEYAAWWVANKMKDDSSLKGFTEILKNPRRLYCLKSFHVNKQGNESSVDTRSIGDLIFNDLKSNRIIILDLASVPMKIAKSLARHIAAHVLNKASSWFSSGDRIGFEKFDALIYIEESQNYLSKEEISSGNSVYERLAKEGRKFNLGLVYVTQQPSAIDQSVTSQTENIIALHMSNEGDCFILNRIKDKFDPLTCKFIKDEAAKGLAYIYAEPHQPFVLPCKIRKFDKSLILKR